MALEIRTKSRVRFFSPFFLIPLIGGNGVRAISMGLGECVNWRKKGIGMRCPGDEVEMRVQRIEMEIKRLRNHMILSWWKRRCVPLRVREVEYLIFPVQSQWCKWMQDPWNLITQRWHWGHSSWDPSKPMCLWRMQEPVWLCEHFYSEGEQHWHSEWGMSCFPKNFDIFHTNSNSFVQGGHETDLCCLILLTVVLG